MIKKLCIFTFSYSPNRKAMIEYFEKIFPEEVEIFLFTTKKNKDKYRFKRTKIVNTTCSRLTSFFELRSFCKKNNIQRLINLGMLPYEGYVMAFASLFLKTDFITYHFGYPFGALKYGSLKDKILTLYELVFSITLSPSPKKILFCSENLYKISKKYSILIKNKIYYNPPTIPTDFFKPLDKRKVRENLGLSKYKNIVIYVGRIGYLKGSDLLLDIAGKNSDKEFLLIGDIIDKELLINFPDNIKLISEKNPCQLVKYYNASDLCLFLSRIESFGLVPREAMSCGIPVIVSDIPELNSIESAITSPLNANIANKLLNNFFNLTKKEIKNLSNKSRNNIIEKYDDKVWKTSYINRILK